MTPELAQIHAQPADRFTHSLGTANLDSARDTAAVVGDRDETRRDDVAYSTFGGGRPTWLGRLDKVRNVVRQEMIARQLDRHMRGHPGSVLDVGAGQGTQSIRLARAGHRVLAVEPDPGMRTAFGAALRAERAEVRKRVTVRDGSIGRLAAVTDGGVYDAVLLLGVLMYLPASEPVIGELAGHVAPGGLLALTARTTTSALWRPAARQDWHAALAALKELDVAQAERRDMRYINELGTPARADGLDALTSTQRGTNCNWRTGMACASPSTRTNSTRRRRPIRVSWRRSSTWKNAWVPPTRTGSWASSRT
jgi:SAM-dependent methyltransferase